MDRTALNSSKKRAASAGERRTTICSQFLVDCCVQLNEPVTTDIGRFFASKNTQNL